MKLGGMPIFLIENLEKFSGWLDKSRKNIIWKRKKNRWNTKRRRTANAWRSWTRSCSMATTSPCWSPGARGPKFEILSIFIQKSFRKLRFILIWFLSNVICQNTSHFTFYSMFFSQNYYFIIIFIKRSFPKLRLCYYILFLSENRFLNDLECCFYSFSVLK